MKMRYLILALVGAMALSLAAAACGSDDDDGDGNGGSELTLEEYFSEMEVLSQSYADDLETLDEEAGAVFDDSADADDALEIFVNFVGDTGSATDDFVGELADIDPPEEVEDAHNEAVDAGEALVDMYDNAVIVLDTAETFQDATAVLDAPGIVDAQVRFGTSCVELQAVAADNDIEADLACPSDI